MEEDNSSAIPNAVAWLVSVRGGRTIHFYAVLRLLCLPLSIHEERPAE